MVLDENSLHMLNGEKSSKIERITFTMEQHEKISDPFFLS
jgi:hypothetical protein